MRRRLRSLVLVVPLFSGVACTAILGDFSTGGDDTSGGDAANGGDGTLGDGAKTGLDGSTDGASNDGADAAAHCGFAGEACCTGPFSPCNPGTACVANVCKVNDVWAIGVYGVFSNHGASAHFDGTSWTRGPDIPLTTSGSESNPYPSSAWVNAPNDARTVTIAGYNIEYQNSPALWRNCGPSDAPCSYPSTTAALWGVYGFGDDDFWIAGTNVMFHCSSSACTSTTAGLTSTTWGQGTFTGTSSGDLWYPQFDRAFHYDGGTWSITNGLQARAIWAHSPTDVWAGDTKLQHFDGTLWSPLYEVDLPDGAPPGNVFSISGSATDDVWAVGYGSAGSFAMHWDGVKWTFMFFPPAALSMNYVWSAGKNDAFAAGTFLDVIYRWNGTTWTAMSIPGIYDAGEGFGPDTANWTIVTGSAKFRP